MPSRRSSAFTVATGALLDLDGFDQTIGSLAGAGNVGLGSATLTTGNDDTSTIFAGAIAGTGGLTKIGAGTFTLSGINLYSGNTNVNGGTLIVNGSIASSSLTTVNAGGTLGGNGTVGNTTINDGGTLSPGSSIGTLTIQGNLVMASAAAYLVEVSPTNADRVDVTGTATLGGTVQAVFAPGSYVGRTYTILTSAGLGGSTFDGLATTNLPGFSASLSYTTTDVILNLTATLGVGAGLNRNQQNVATAINGFFNNGGALPPNFVNVFGLTGGNLANTLSLLSGEAATGARQGAFQLGGQFLGLMLDPFVDGRGGIAVAGGPALGFAPERAALPDDIALAYGKVTKAPPDTRPRRRHSSSAGPPGAARSAATTAPAATPRSSAATISPPKRRALPPGSTIISAATPCSASRSPAAAPTGASPTASAAARAMRSRPASTRRRAPALRTSRHRSPSPITGCRPTATRRSATISPPASTPRASAPASRAATASARRPARSRRMARCRRRASTRPTYSETDVDGGGFGLTYNTRTAHDIRGELGARFDHVALVDPTAVLTLRSRLAWAHGWVSDPSLAAAFQALPGASFIVNGAAPAKDSALASAGAELKLANGVTLSAKLDGEFASRAQTYTGTGTVRVSW